MLQFPQFLLEAGYGCRKFAERAGMVAVTQPRRLAAISSAQRVAAELGHKVGPTVGYQVSHCSYRPTILRYYTCISRSGYLKLD